MFVRTIPPDSSSPNNKLQPQQLSDSKSLASTALILLIKADSDQELRLFVLWLASTHGHGCIMNHDDMSEKAYIFRWMIRPRLVSGNSYCLFVGPNSPVEM